MRVFQYCSLNSTTSLVNAHVALINWKIKTILMFQLLLFVLLCILSGDIELNPGPVKWPCLLCSKLVKSNQDGIECSSCL